MFGNSDQVDMWNTESMTRLFALRQDTIDSSLYFLNIQADQVDISISKLHYDAVMYFVNAINSWKAPAYSRMLSTASIKGQVSSPLGSDTDGSDLESSQYFDVQDGGSSVFASPISTTERKPDYMRSTSPESSLMTLMSVLISVDDGQWISHYYLRVITIF